MTRVDVDHDAEIADRLGRAFAVWRLRPGDPEQGSFVTACARLADEVTPRAGLTLGIRGAGFVTADGQRVDARAAGSLAETMYRLGIERLRIHRAPTPGELDRFLGAIEAATDREDLHHRLGAVNAVLEPISLAPTTVARDAVEDLEGWRETWDALADPAAIARELMTAGTTEPADVVRRMVALRDALPDDRQRSPVLADRLHGLIVNLPGPLRIAVAGDLISAPDVPFSGWLLCSLTDHDLGRLLEGVDEDVAGLARRALGRQLTDLCAEPEVRPSTGAGPVDAPSGSRLLADEPLSAGSLELFLSVEHRPGRLRAALLHWRRRVAAALHEDELATVHELLALLDRVAAVSEHDVLAVLDAARTESLGPAEVEVLLPPAGEGMPARAEELLRAYGGHAIDALVARLVAEEEAQRRAQLVSVLATLVPGNTNALTRWLDDPRWFVVRNVVTALWRAADPAAMPLLARTLAHPEPRVRLETARALSTIGGVAELAHLAADPDAEVRTSARRMLSGLGSSDAAVALARVAHDARVPLTDRRSAIEALSGHPHGAAHLRILADDHDLPRRLRWHAARLTSAGDR